MLQHVGLEQYLHTVLWARSPGRSGAAMEAGRAEEGPLTRVITLLAGLYIGILHKIPSTERFPKVVYSI